MTPCSIEGCHRPHYGKGWCEAHYARWRRHGSTVDRRARKLDPMGRLLSRVVKTDGCWLWTGPPNGSGYGTFRLDGRVIGAHVAMVLLEGREIPDGHEVDHTCVTPLCVRPGHLEVVTGYENNMRSTSVAALNARKTHCQNDHAFTPENTRVTKYGRNCRTCHRDRERAAYHRRKVASAT